MAEQRYFHDETVRGLLEEVKDIVGYVNTLQHTQLERKGQHYFEVGAHQTSKLIWNDLERGFVHQKNGSVSKQVVKDSVVNCAISLSHNGAIDEMVKEIVLIVGTLSTDQHALLKEKCQYYLETVAHQTTGAIWKDLENGFVHESNGSVSKKVVHDAIFKCIIP